MNEQSTYWYAVRTRQESLAEKFFRERCDEVFFPKEEIVSSTGATRQRAVIPRVMFIRTTRQHALDLEQQSRTLTDTAVSFWIYRYSAKGDIQPINNEQIQLIRLLTTNDATRCEIFRKTDFKRGQLVRVTGGIYEGYVGTVQRVRKNKHVVVEIEGICMIMLPYIHPDLLETISE